MDDLSGGFERNVPDGVTFVKASFQNVNDVKQVFAQHGPFTYVYHLGAYWWEGLSHFIRNYNY